MHTTLLAPDTAPRQIKAQSAVPPSGNSLLGKTLKKIDESAKDFEAMFISEMIKPMFEGLKTDGPFGGGKGEEIFRGLLVQEYGKILSHSGGIGMSPQIREQMIQLQEQHNHATS